MPYKDIQLKEDRMMDKENGDDPDLSALLRITKLEYFNMSFMQKQKFAKRYNSLKDRRRTCK